MRIIVYPETIEGDIGHFDDMDVKPCMLIKASADDLQKVDLIFKLCELFHNPIVYIGRITTAIPVVKAEGRSYSEKFGKDNLFSRIDRSSLIACVDGEGLSEAEAVEYLRDDIRQMIRTANLIFETRPDLIPTLDDIFLDEIVSIMANLATALEVVLNECVPLRPRFDVIESEGVCSLGDFEEIINALRSHKDEQ